MIVDKLTRERGALVDMVDLGGVRAVVGEQDAADDLVRGSAVNLTPSGRTTAGPA